MDQDLKLIALHDKLKADMDKLKEELVIVEKQIGPKGDTGPKGDKGKDGKNGKDGVDGKDGRDGVDGKDGRDGTDGTSITDVDVDFDNHLRISLSDGSVIDAGEISPIVSDEAITRVIGMGGARSEGDSNVYIQDTQPVASGKYLWIDTSGTDITFWVEDGA